MSVKKSKLFRARVVKTRNVLVEHFPCFILISDHIKVTYLFHCSQNMNQKCSGNRSEEGNKISKMSRKFEIKSLGQGHESKSICLNQDLSVI